MRLLLIDDDELDRQAIVRALRQVSDTYVVIQASTANEGLALARTHHFDVVLLDYHLPDQDGIEVLQCLHSEKFQIIAVIMLSHQEDDILAERCLDAGAQDFLLKDEVNSRRLIRAVRQAKHRFSNELALREMRQLSECDPLTGLANRRAFEKALAAATRERRNKLGLAVLLLDLDDFKSVNDTLGHDAGDELLIQIARRLKAIVRDCDFLCRLGGDEFIVLMMDFDEGDQAAILANRIVAEMQKPITLGTSERLVTTSIGIAIMDDSTKSASDLFKCADIAMYQAKRDGRNQSRFYSVILQETLEYKVSMKQAMLKALERNEFRLYYQAQINSADGNLAGMEALLRWDHPTLGILTPDAFLGLAEETGLIVNIGNWVIGEACGQLKKWQMRQPLRRQTLKLAVNLSATQIKHESLGNVIRKMLSQHHLDANGLEIEITESAMIEDTAKIASLLTDIVDQGVMLSLDDFGTGYSSLEHLRLFPISILKIDKAFIASIGLGDIGEKMLTAIIAFAKALQMTIVAEGVETQEQAEFCKRNGCDLLQGYFYSRPVPADQFEAEFLRCPEAEAHCFLNDRVLVAAV